MPHRFKEGNPVFYTPNQPEFINLKGVYTIHKANSEGTVYRIMDGGGEFTDADEEELQAAIYSVFVRKDTGWPIIVPTYDEKLYKHYKESETYSFHLGGDALNCIKEQLLLLKRLEGEGK